MRLAGRRVLVTGAASGIGRAVAELFRAEGAAVALLDRNAALLEEVAAGFTAGPPVTALPCDVTDEDAVAAAVARAATEMDGIDGIVGAAGVDLMRPFDEMTLTDWRRVMDVNLTGAFLVCLAATPHLKAAGQGTVVQVASGAALRPLATRTAYCTAKAGLVMFAKTLAVDLAPHGVRVNAICPGIIDTPMFHQSYEGAEDPAAALDSILERYLIRRVGQPGDIANAALFLSSDDSRHVTGTALAVDGGRTFH